MKERADASKGAEQPERPAVIRESAVDEERPASTSESADADERPRFKLGYPKIQSETHHLWVDQQTDWPHHLPHEAWQEMVRAYNREPAERSDSSKHPAFQPDYAPNEVATPDAKPPPPAVSTAKARR